MSASITNAFPAPPMRSARTSRRSRRRATTATVAPSSARAAAVASPMPLLAPVTRATVPSSFFVMEPPPTVPFGPCSAPNTVYRTKEWLRSALRRGPAWFVLGVAVGVGERLDPKQADGHTDVLRDPGRRVAIERLAAEEVGSDDPVDNHQYHSEEHGGDDEHENTADHVVGSRECPGGVAVARGNPVVPNEPHHAEPENEAAEQGEDAAQPQAASALRQAAAVVPDAGETGQTVVEGDHGAEGRHGVPDHAAPVRKVVHHHVQRDGHDTHGH